MVVGNVRDINYDNDKLWVDDEKLLGLFFLKAGLI
jgi:hypothetical protein